MKVTYDSEQDVLQMSFGHNPVQETTQIAPGIILDYDEDGKVIGIELRQASSQLDNPYEICYTVGPANENKPQPKVSST